MELALEQANKSARLPATSTKGLLHLQKLLLPQPTFSQPAILSKTLFLSKNLLECNNVLLSIFITRNYFLPNQLPWLNYQRISTHHAFDFLMVDKSLKTLLRSNQFDPDELCRRVSGHNLCLWNYVLLHPSVYRLLQSNPTTSFDFPHIYVRRPDIFLQRDHVSSSLHKNQNHHSGILPNNFHRWRRPRLVLQSLFLCLPFCLISQRY